MARGRVAILPPAAAAGDAMGKRVSKLSDYVELAASEYFLETGRIDLDARWIAAFFQDGGVMDAYPRQDLVAFSALVQKALTKHAEHADKAARLYLARITRLRRRLQKP